MARHRVDEPKEEKPALTKVDEKEPQKEPSPKSTRTESPRKSPLWHLSMSALSLGLVACGYALGYLAHSDPSLAIAPWFAHSPSGDSTVQRHLELKDAVLLNEDGKIYPKYETDIVRIEGQHFLQPAECSAPAPQFEGFLVHVKVAMAKKETLRASDRIFLLLNGQNDGIYVSWNGNASCLHAAAKSAAIALGADRDRLQYGIRLYNQHGLPIISAADLEANHRIAHILLEYQIWVWPGIELGHEYNVDGVILKTVGLKPLVYAVSNFFTSDEATAIIEAAQAKLERSKVNDANTSKAVSASRTSHTAFLTTSAFTRDFQRRSAKLARLPSPSYAEGLQLVRYAAGEFYRRHLDTFDSVNLLPKGYYARTIDDYKAWAAWAAAQLDALGDGVVPAGFRKGEPLYPNPDDDTTFPLALVDAFLKVGLAENYFAARHDGEWVTWMQGYVEKKSPNIMAGIMKDKGKPHYLDKMVRVWEDMIGLSELRYTFPKTKRINGVSHFYQWVRWVKERISALGTSSPVHPSSPNFPKYSWRFGQVLANILLEDLSEEFLVHQTNREWYDWLVTNRNARDAVFKAMAAFPNMAEVSIRAWESRVQGGAVLRYRMPSVVKHFEPNRFVTLFLYLNEVDEGGETVFPFSSEKLVTDIERTGMEECSNGLAVPPTKLKASLFYVQTPDQEIDVMSRHGGCPPMQGVKWGSNSFMWNADAEEGADLYNR
ncbi:hypothetical protein AeMF1_018531 [Aphanomyces euteiches]|nr:hypothetical protein AeMF1_018531 [Aphanomyces euteiches]